MKPVWTMTGIEVFAPDIDTCLLNITGQTFSFENVSADYLKPFANELASDNDAQHGLDLLEISKPIARLKRYMICRYGGNDCRCDVSGSEANPDYFHCSTRGNCAAEGLLCLPVQAKNGELTKTEVLVAQLIAADLSDKLIADVRQCSVHTVAEHRRALNHKIGCYSSKGIVSFAHRAGLIN